jgi:hypothetical protein
LGTIDRDDHEEAVIIAGAADATPFPDFPYLHPKAHTHPVKPLIHTPGRERYGRVIPPVKRAVSCKVDEVMLPTKAFFAVDLLPSVEDVDQTASRNTPQTVFVNYKYDQTDQAIVNPAAIEDGRDVSNLPWINFVIGVPTPPKGTGGKPQVVLTMKANNTVVKSWTIEKLASKQWWTA